jgi:hypothetical protein
MCRMRDREVPVAAEHNLGASSASRIAHSGGPCQPIKPMYELTTDGWPLLLAPELS